MGLAGHTARMLPMEGAAGDGDRFDERPAPASSKRREPWDATEKDQRDWEAFWEESDRAPVPAIEPSPAIAQDWDIVSRCMAANT